MSTSKWTKEEFDKLEEDLLDSMTKASYKSPEDRKTIVEMIEGLKKSAAFKKFMEEEKEKNKEKPAKNESGNGKIFFDQLDITETLQNVVTNSWCLALRIPFKMSVENQIQWAACTPEERKMLENSLNIKIIPLVQKWVESIGAEMLGIKFVSNTEVKINVDFKASKIAVNLSHFESEEDWEDEPTLPRFFKYHYVKKQIK